jgi:hypothetical protein
VIRKNNNHISIKIYNFTLNSTYILIIEDIQCFSDFSLGGVSIAKRTKDAPNSIATSRRPRGVHFFGSSIHKPPRRPFVTSQS